MEKEFLQAANAYINSHEEETRAAMEEIAENLREIHQQYSGKTTGGIFRMLGGRGR